MTSIHTVEKLHKRPRKHLLGVRNQHETVAGKACKCEVGQVGYDQKLSVHSKINVETNCERNCVHRQSAHRSLALSSDSASSRLSS